MPAHDLIYWILEGEGASSSPKDLSAEGLLSPLEFERWQGMRFEKRREEFLFGRYTARKLLTAAGLPWAGVDPRSLPILNEPDGAPYLDQPECSGSLTISHRGKLAASAYYPSGDRHVGIDLEIIEPRNWSFVEDFFTQAETESAKRLMEPHRAIWVTLMWSAKEAVLKVWRKGLRIDTREIEIKPIGADELDSLAQGWVSIGFTAKDDRNPVCWLFGRVFGNSILTLAYTRLSSDGLEPPVRLMQVDS